MSPDSRFHLQVFVSLFHFSPSVFLYILLPISVYQAVIKGILNIAFTVITRFLLELIACWTFISPLSRHRVGGGGEGGRIDLINLHLAGRDGSQIHITHSRMHFPSLTFQLVDRGLRDKGPGGQGKRFALEISMFVNVCVRIWLWCASVCSVRSKVSLSGGASGVARGSG